MNLLTTGFRLTRMFYSYGQWTSLHIRRQPCTPGEVEKKTDCHYLQPAPSAVSSLPKHSSTTSLTKSTLKCIILKHYFTLVTTFCLQLKTRISKYIWVLLLAVSQNILSYVVFVNMIGTVYNMIGTVYNMIGTVYNRHLSKYINHSCCFITRLLCIWGTERKENRKILKTILLKAHFLWSTAPQPHHRLLVVSKIASCISPNGTFIPLDDSRYICVENFLQDVFAR